MGGALARDIPDRAQRRAAIGTGHGSGAGIRYFVALSFVFGRVVVHALVGAADGAESLARSPQRPGAASVGEDAEVTDAMHPVGQDMQQETPDELVDGDGGGAVAGLSLARFPGLSVPEGDLLAVECDDPAVRDGDPVGVAREVPEHLLGPVEGPLGVDHPVPAAGGGEGGVELAGIGKMGDGAVELQPPSAMGAGQLLEEAAAEQAGEDLDGGQEGAAPGLPLAAVDIEAGIGRHHVQMRMEEQLLVPGMEKRLRSTSYLLVLVAEFADTLCSVSRKACMFCRAKVSGSNTYIQIVENHREGKKVRQRVIATLVRLDHLQESSALDRLLQSACRFSEQLMVLAAQPGDGEDGAEVRRIGPALAFEGLWRTKEVRDDVLTDTGAMTEITVARAHDPEPLTLEIKEAVLPRSGEDGQEPKERRRYVVCRNPAEARRDAASRAAMVADLETKLKSGAKALIGN